LNKFSIFLISVSIFLSVSSAYSSTREISIPDKTPTDVYRLALTLEKSVKQLRDEQEIFDAWPLVRQQAESRAPRHVLQKSIEVLEKINRLRQIRKLGPITITAYPSRYITPNEVYDSVERLVGEVDLLLENKIELPTEKTVDRSKKRYEPRDVYTKLWEVSLALDPLLGSYGFTPSDVYAQARYVNELIRFLRLSQNLPEIKALPERQHNRHPNHALQAAYHLLARINRAERNLWMQPEPVPVVPRRVIRPTEVFDALQIVIAELRRITFRLGIERNIPLPQVESGKSPADVIQLLNWAEGAMPQFEPGSQLYQYNPQSLSRKPADVLDVARQIEQGLMHYQQQRGIRAAAPEVALTEGLAPKHVYQKTLANLKKVDRLRQQTGLGEMVVPDYPLRAITPNEVYDLATRLRDELEIVYQHSGVRNVPATVAVSLQADRITPSDVYRQMEGLSMLLDTALGSNGYPLRDLYRATTAINSELLLLVRYRGRDGEVALPELSSYATESQVLEAAHEVLKLVEMVQYRTGLVGDHVPRQAISGRVSLSDLFNTVDVISTELVSLKLQLGITERAALEPDTGLQPGLEQVLVQLQLAQSLLKQRLLEE